VTEETLLFVVARLDERLAILVFAVASDDVTLAIGAV
jgi:hypothetical protein